MIKKELNVNKLDYSNELEIDKLTKFLKNLFTNYSKKKWVDEYLLSPETSHSFISKHDENIIAHSALIGLNFIKNGKIFIVSKFEGSLIDINYLKSLSKEFNKRVFEKICIELINYTNNSKSSLIFGFPSIQASQTQRKAGFKINKKKLKVKIFLLNTNKIFKKKSNIYLKPFLKIINIINKLLVYYFSKENKDIHAYNKNFYKRFIDYQSVFSLENSEKILLFMDNKYIQWKFKQDNIDQIFILNDVNKIRGYFIIQVKKNVTSILDISANTIFDYVKMLRHLIFIFKNKDIKFIDIWFDVDNESKKLQIALYLSGFLFFYNFNKTMLFFSHLNFKFKSIIIKKILLR